MRHAAISKLKDRELERVAVERRKTIARKKRKRAVPPKRPRTAAQLRNDRRLGAFHAARERDDRGWFLCGALPKEKIAQR